jgi:hypothetical protein
MSAIKALGYFQAINTFVMTKLPASVLEARGAFEKDPQRKRVDPVASGDLGNAPGYFTDGERKVWKELKGQIPEGVAKSADRMIVEICCRLMFKYRSDKLNGTELSLLVNTLGKLGMSPADRSKCSVPVQGTKDNEFSEFA